MSDERQPIGVVGVGWVGLVTATCFAELGHRVIALDIVEEKVEALRRGEVTIHEPGLAELLARNAERLEFTTSMDATLAAARLLFCCVDTPPTYSGDADLSRVQAVVQQLPAGSEHALVMKSTVPSGTGAAIRRDKPDLAYVSCPEFLKEGSAIDDFMKPDRVVVGADAGSEWAADAVEELYRPLGGELVRTDVASAEMIKHASNAFLATKISFINEIANVCERTGADVVEVARGMGLDQRIGPSFLRAGVGYGGSCFVPDETVLVRIWGSPRLVTFAELWDLAAGDAAATATGRTEPERIEVWSWVPGEGSAEWMPVSALTKRRYEGDVVEVRTKMGRRLEVTEDHPFVVGTGSDMTDVDVIPAAELTTNDWLPLAFGSPASARPATLSILGATEGSTLEPEAVIVWPDRHELEKLALSSAANRRAVLTHRTGQAAPRPSEIRRMSTLRLADAWRGGLGVSAARIGTSRSGNSVPTTLSTDESFWRVVGLYLAEGCAVRADSCDSSPLLGLNWSFHPTSEDHLVEEVVEYWERQGISSRTVHARTSHRVSVFSRVLATWWIETLRMGRNGYEQRLPDLIWEQSDDRKRALLSGMWEGDGCCKLVNQGRSPVLEWGTVSGELADGVARLLASLGLIASWHRGRGRLSTRETHWLSISGSDQIKAAEFLVSEPDRQRIKDALSRQTKHMSPAGFRWQPNSVPSVRVTGTRRRRYQGDVYSMEVPFSHTIAASGGLIVHNCFPKDVDALKMLAGNSGYHFQLLNAVIEVNELQKRRVIAKLEKHLGSLVGKKIALLGLAFKPDTDDMREATSLVLSARLQGEGAVVTAYDPVAQESATGLLPSVEMARSAADALDGADAVVLVTEWKEFADLDWPALSERMATPLVVDGRNFLDAEALRDAGFTYEGIGRPSGNGGGS